MSQPVEILSSKPGQDHRLLPRIWDGGTRYADIWRPPEVEERERLARDRAVREAAWLGYQQKNPEKTRADFDVDWPAIAADLAGRTPTSVVAILDTGLLAHHPRIRPALQHSVDCTGSGKGDRNGHGTTCALILLHSGPHRIIDVKVIDDDGYGTIPAFISGLHWLAEYRQSRPDVPLLANLSIGYYSTNWLGRHCRGSCELCAAAIECARSGVKIVAAAGNKPGITACPATVAVHRQEYLDENNLFIFANAAWDFDGGVGNIAWGSGHVGFTQLR